MMKIDWISESTIRSLRSRQIALTGSSGFIGAALTQTLRHLEIDFIELTGDVLKSSTFEHPFDVLIHLASAMPAHFANDAELAWDVNTLGVQQAITACARNQATLVFPSTSGVYKGTKEPISIDESQLPDPDSKYARSKLNAEKICQEHFRRHGTAHSILRIFNAYGVGQPAQSVIGYIMNCVQNNRPAIIKNPSAIRDYVHVRDIKRAILLGAIHPQPNPINIGSGKGHSVAQIVDLLQLRLENNIAVEFQASETPSIFISNPNLASKVLGWRPEVSIDQGLDEVCGLVAPLV